MKLRLWLLLLSACVAWKANAVCTARGTAPYTFSIPAMIVNIDADAPADTTTPISRTDTATQGSDLYFDNCHTGDFYGKSSLFLTTQGNSYIYPSNIAGIGIKVLWNNGGAFSSGQFPTQGTMDFSGSTPPGVGAWVYPANSYYRVEVYKTADTLDLNPQSLNIALTAGTYAYNWVTSDSLSNAGQVLTIGSIQIVSTPSCSFDNSKIVDFGTVTGDMLNAGSQVPKALDFSITCRTDYGTYSTTASLSSETASADNGYINVTDANGATDTLAIKVEDSAGNWLKLDGSNSETINSIASSVPTDFHWKATLMAQPGVQKHPAEGNFTAHAEILLQVK